MLIRAQCEGYRAFRDLTTLNLRRLTIVFGRNNSGKTTLTRLPLFVAAGLRAEGLYSLNDSHGIRFGSSFRDITSHEDPFPELAYTILSDSGPELAVKLQSVASQLNEVVQLRRLASGDEAIEFEAGQTHDPSGAFVLNRGSLDIFPERIGFRIQQVNAELEHSVHVPSARPAVKPIYEARAALEPSVNETPYLLYSHPDLVTLVSAWFQKALDGIDVDVERAGSGGFRLVTGSRVEGVNFASTGRGCQALLPLVVLVHAVELGIVPCDLLVVEEPEAHLHPSAHGAVGELLARASKKTQVLAETHSENLILRLRRRIAEDGIIDGQPGYITPDNFNLVFVDELHDVVDIEVDATGGVSDWPAGVFEDDVREAQAIVEVKLRAHGMTT